MPTGVKGTILEGDASIITFVGWLHRQQSREDGFVIDFLGKTALFIRHDRLDFVQEQIRLYVASMATLKNKGDVDEEDDGLGARDGEDEGKIASSRRAAKPAKSSSSRTRKPKRASPSSPGSAAAAAAAVATPTARTSLRSKQAGEGASAARAIDEATDEGVAEIDDDDDDIDEDVSHLLDDDDDDDEVVDEDEDFEATG